ncbi:MAG: NUDIX domain-containing protein [Firmicutes bacterium]|nr:NUDIX domain-containing protein [Bacillota bacterium]
MRQLLVTAAIVQEGDRVLLARRRPDSHLGGFWEFPGGQVEPGETPEAALCREIREELGCEVEVESLFDVETHLDPAADRQAVILFYRCRRVAGEPTSREGQEVAWVTRGELLTYPLAPADRRVAGRIALAAGAGTAVAEGGAPALAPEEAPTGAHGSASGGTPAGQAPGEAPAGPATGRALLDRVVLVLYQPQDVVNVAGVIRVMSNFGLRRLRLVEPAAFDPYRILGIAHHTEAIVAGVERYPDLPSALADCGLVLGTTSRPREVRRERITPRQGAGLLLRAAALAAGAEAGGGTGAPPAPGAAAGAGGLAGGLVAVLFGREKDGLPNEALLDCHGIITIPTAPENRSLNLAQAALVVAYELWLAAIGLADQPLLPPARPAAPGTPPDPGAPPQGDEPRSLIRALEEDARLASGQQREEMFRAVADLLRALYPGTTDARVARSVERLRAVLLRAAPRADEATMLAHLFQHVARALREARGAGGAEG